VLDEANKVIKALGYYRIRTQYDLLH